MTCDMWHVTCDMLWGWSFCQNFSSLALRICDSWCFEYILTNHNWLIQLINDKAVSRTAPATPGLLNMGLKFIFESTNKGGLEKLHHKLTENGKFWISKKFWALKYHGYSILEDIYKWWWQNPNFGDPLGCLVVK